MRLLLHHFKFAEDTPFFHQLFKRVNLTQALIVDYWMLSVLHTKIINLMATPAQYVLSWRQRWRRLWRENCREVGSLLYLGVQHVQAVEVLAVLVLLFVPDKVLPLLLVQGRVVLPQLS